MKIEIKKSKNPVKYKEAIEFMEARLLKIDNISVYLVRNLDVSCESSYIEVWIYLKDI